MSTSTKIIVAALNIENENSVVIDVGSQKCSKDIYPTIAVKKWETPQVLPSESTWSVGPEWREGQTLIW